MIPSSIFTSIGPCGAEAKIAVIFGIDGISAPNSSVYRRGRGRDDDFLGDV